MGAVAVGKGRPLRLSARVTDLAEGSAKDEDSLWLTQTNQRLLLSFLLFFSGRRRKRPARRESGMICYPIAFSPLQIFTNSDKC